MPGRLAALHRVPLAGASVQRTKRRGENYTGAKLTSMRMISRPMELVDEARKLCAVAARLEGPVGNRANTKALLIEPLLSVLGWDTSNLEHVVRDWPVAEDELISYALRVEGANVVLVESRGANENLDAASFVSGTLKRAENYDVRWWVLTNGLIYRLYKANEPFAKDDGLLFEVDLAAVAADSSADSRDSISLLSRDSLLGGDLERRGEELFTDGRVRAALQQLVANPSPEFLGAIAQALGTSQVPEDRLRTSLARALDQEASTPSNPTAPSASEPQPVTGAATRPPMAPEAEKVPVAAAPTTGAVPQADVRVPVGRAVHQTASAADAASTAESVMTLDRSTSRQSEPARSVVDESHPGPFAVGRAEHPLADHLAGKPAAIVELFDRLDEYGCSFGDDAMRRVGEHQVAYLRGRQLCFTLELQHHRIVMRLPLDPAAVQAWWWSTDATRYMIDIRAHGAGETEYSVSDVKQLDDAMQLIKLAYDRVAVPDLTA